MKTDKVIDELAEIGDLISREAAHIAETSDGRLIPPSERNPFIDVHSLFDAVKDLDRVIVRLRAYAEGDDPPLFDEDPLVENEDL